MESEGLGGHVAPKLAGANLVDREKLNTLRDELHSMQTMSNVAIVAEVVTGYFFTWKGLLKTIGYTGRVRVEKLAEGSNRELVKKLGTESLKSLIQKNKAAGMGTSEAVRKAVAEYWPRAKEALKNARRMTVVAGNHAAAQTLVELLGTKLSRTFMKDKKPLREFFVATKERLEREAETELRIIGNYQLSQVSKGIDDGLSVFGKDAEKTAEVVRRMNEATAKQVADLKRGQRAANKEGRVTLAVDRNVVANAERLPVGDRMQLWLKGFRKGKYERAKREAAFFESLIKKLDAAPVSKVAGETETAAFFRSLEPDDFGLLRKHIQYSHGALPRKLRRSVVSVFGFIEPDDFKRFEYLMNDWKMRDEFAIAYSRLGMRELHDLIIDEQGNVWAAHEFKRQPDGTYRAQKFRTNEKGEVVRDEKGRPVGVVSDYTVDPEHFYEHPEEYLDGTLLLQKKGEEGISWKKGKLSETGLAPDPNAPKETPPDPAVKK
jgi:hypothetical protein